MREELNIAPQPQFHERRRDERSRLIIEIYFDGQDTTGVAHTRDISLGGLYLNTRSPIKEGADIKLRFQFGQDQMVIDAVVIYSNPGHGVGVRFVNLSAEHLALLERELPQP
ncbi:MAG TPA: PilZ domain-containing protein [Pyrinomonadaceae bacterium]|jgi:hypothetical protein|nr:PilZ domain-containing protein [Pyrinomonadaceae bacterium]